MAGNETPAGGAADTTLDPATTGDTVVRPAASGHFTTMQVRGGRVQGFDLHVTRLRMASRELYGTTPGASDIRARVHEALLDAGMEEGDCTLRVRVEPAQPVEPVEPCRSGYSRDRDTAIAAIAAPAMAVDIEAPRALGASPLRLQTLRALRRSPHLKHLALAPQLHARDAARTAGFDDALLLTPEGHVAEGSFWNIVLWDGSTVIWPEAPILDGVTQRLLQAALRDAGVSQRHAPVPGDGLSAMRAAFAVNSRGVQEVASVDGHVFEGDARFGTLLRELLAACPWQRP